MTAPLVVTLAVDDDAQERLQALRTAHFPPEREVVPRTSACSTRCPATARVLVQRLTASLVPWQLRATGVHVWRYLGGPWEHVETVPLAP